MDFSYSTKEFYEEQMIAAINHLASGDIQGAGKAVFSFFEGKEHVIGKEAIVSSQHILAFYKLTDLSDACYTNKALLPRWIAATYRYFKEKAALPTIAEEILPICLQLLTKLKADELDNLNALTQMAFWDFQYGKKHHSNLQKIITSRKLETKTAKNYRSLFLTTDLNPDPANIIKNIENTYKQRKAFTHQNLAITIINYYCKISKNSEHLEELIKVLKGPSLKGDIANGRTDFLQPLIMHLYEQKEYHLMLKFLGNLKNSQHSPQGLSTPHAFLLSNAEKLSLLSPNWLDIFENQDNYESYEELTNSKNRATNTFTSLLGGIENGAANLDPSRAGAPPESTDLESYAAATIKHFKLKDNVYGEISLLTLAPSHSFPIQSALFSLGKNSPLISTSLEDQTEEPEQKHFAFMLSTHTSSYNIEKEFIEREFGEKANIFTNPSPQVFEETLNNAELNAFYISAHGEYNHWKYGSSDEIFFSDDSIIPMGTIRKCSLRRKTKSNIILNICDGATSAINCIPYSRGIASTLANGAQTVTSHLWPVNPVYACSFGLINIFHLKSAPAIDAAKLTFDTLRLPKQDMLNEIRKLSDSFAGLATYLDRTDFEMSQFKNIGSVAIYS